MKNKELEELEKQIIKDFKSLSGEIQAYFQEETLEPEEIINGNYQKYPIRKRTIIINRAENWARTNIPTNDELIKAQGYLGLVSQYFLEKANSKVEETLSDKEQ